MRDLIFACALSVLEILAFNISITDKIVVLLFELSNDVAEVSTDGATTNSTAGCVSLSLVAHLSVFFLQY